METAEDKLTFSSKGVAAQFETHDLSGFLRQLVASVQDFDGQCHRVVFATGYLSLFLSLKFSDFLQCSMSAQKTGIVWYISLEGRCSICIDPTSES